MITFFIIVYLLSALLNYIYIRLAYSKGGILERDTPNDGDIAMTFIPVLNTVFCLLMWIGQSPRVEIEKEKKVENRSKFFRIKK